MQRERREDNTGGVRRVPYEVTQTRDLQTQRLPGVGILSSISHSRVPFL